jgi:hypothetical protein
MTLTFAGVSPKPKKPLFGVSSISYVTRSVVAFNFAAPADTAASTVFPSAIVSFFTI